MPNNVLPEDFIRAVKYSDYSSVCFIALELRYLPHLCVLIFNQSYLITMWFHSLKQATTKINIAVDKLPQFQCCKMSHPDAGPQHMGTIHIGSEKYPFISMLLVS